jgi:hypothetical protein
MGSGPLDAPSLWENFRGKPNTAALLMEKAHVVAALIAQDWDTGLTIASGMRDKNPQIRLGEVESRQARAETAALLLRLVDEIARAHLGRGDRDRFMDTLEADVAMALRDKGLEPSAFTKLLQERYTEYGNYRKWVSKEGAKGTLLWEFAKKVASILGVGRNALFNRLLAWSILRSLERWELPVLLQG